ncbi:metallophosphoesterase [Nocardia farcinica]|uniref:metallophosphoesterase n=1 Tax=Nocardia farcinica TaxID=37329 RepID=UPI002454A1A2|nr:metallophosphoesterase [Nocardia farcinica]
MGRVVALLVIAVLVAILGLAHWYVWRRLVRDTTAAGSVGRRVGTGVVVVGGVFLVGTLATRADFVPFALVRVVSTVGYLWAAVFVYLLLGVLVGEVLRPVLVRLPFGRGRVEPAAPAPEAPNPSTTVPTLSRRLFVNRALAGATALAAVATVAGGTHNVLNGPAVNHVRIPIRRLSPEAAGFRITLVSDLHLGPVLDADFARKVVDTVNGTEPDLIAIAGDLVDGTVADLRTYTAPIADLRASQGVFFCMGNHEYYSAPDEWIEHLPSLGVRVLLNERAELPWFDIAGVDDIEGEAYDRGPDFDATLGGRDPARPCVLLAHQPVLVHDAVDYDVDLVLSGHTHGGQIFPGNLLARLANPTVAGLERYGDTQLYVTRGAGAWGPPVRVAAPSDITVLELVPA